jgi:glycosyltransferase involved in cell wall biosynthesis
MTVLERVNARIIPDVALEVIVVDDGSKDGTAKLLEARPSLYTKFLKLPQNGGKGAAVRAGLRHATGDYVLFQDADLEYDPADYARLLEPIRRFDADVVMGSRMLAPEFTRVHYFWHKRGNELLTFIFNLVNNTTFTDTYTCYLLYRRSLLEPTELESDGWEQHAEILSRLVRRAKTIYEVPVTYAGRTYAEGKKIRASHALDVVGMILRRRIAAFWESPWTTTTTTSTRTDTKITNGQSSSPSSFSKDRSSTGAASFNRSSTS